MKHHSLLVLILIGSFARKMSNRDSQESSAALLLNNYHCRKFTQVLSMIPLPIKQWPLQTVRRTKQFLMGHASISV